MCSFMCCCFPWGNNETSEPSDSPRTQTPLLEEGSSSETSTVSTTSSSGMRGSQRRTYGKKKTVGTYAATAVFGGPSESSPLLQNQRSPSLSLRPRQISPRDPLVDISAVIENLSIADTGGAASADVSETAAVKTLTTADDRIIANVSGLLAVADNESVSVSRRPANTDNVPHGLGPLQELLDAYRYDCGYPLELKNWDEIIEGHLSIVKIAEASFAEVYRITTKHGSSILKVMQLKMPSDPPSMDSYTAVEVKSIVAEIRIMNAMTEIPGFVSFKDAHLVQGKPGTAISKAWSSYLLRFSEGKPDVPDRSSYFPNPNTYADQSFFLVVELGDAGEVLQYFRVDTQDKLFDIFIGTAVILSRAEQESEFEHRDLHENNICISYRETAKSSTSLPGTVLFGRSGLEVTLIDYGLSRARLPTGEVMFYDLEEDLVIFRGEEGKPQFDTYRRMRSHLFTGRRNMFKRSWHNEESRAKNNGHTWAEYIPYTNVLWLKYIFGWLREQYLRGLAFENHDLFYNISGISELSRNFDMRSKQGFNSATEVLIFSLEQGWITDEQIEQSGIDTTILSEYSTVEA